MIICFSGTGNSRYVADLLQDILGDELVRFPPGLMRDPERIKLEVYDDRVIWVFPVHSWGMPTTVKKVLKSAKIFSKRPLLHYMVCTCGDDIGYTAEKWREAIKRRGWQPASAFSIQMPNTYVFMPGFDIDPQDVTNAKLAAVPERVCDIAEMIENGDVSSVDVVRGKWPWLKSNIIKPWFDWWMTRTAPFHSTNDCVGCGRCAHNCPIGIITMVEKRPKWIASHCIMCSRCYNCCPRHAIAYGSATKGKGQYVCPEYTLQD